MNIFWQSHHQHIWHQVNIYPQCQQVILKFLLLHNHWYCILIPYLSWKFEDEEPLSENYLQLDSLKEVLNYF